MANILFGTGGQNSFADVLRVVRGSLVSFGDMGVRRNGRPHHSRGSLHVIAGELESQLSIQWTVRGSCLVVSFWAGSHAQGALNICRLISDSLIEAFVVARS